jgi:hypothetical protein
MNVYYKSSASVLLFDPNINEHLAVTDAGWQWYDLSGCDIFVA